MSWVMNETFLRDQLNGTGVVDFDTHVMKIALTTSATAPNATTDTTFPPAGVVEVTGTGYTAGGATVANATVTLNAGTVTVDGDAVIWSQNAGGFNNARYAWFYSTSNNRIVATADLLSNKGNDSNDLQIDYPNGFFTVTAV